jgi:hypothetical protein
VQDGDDVLYSFFVDYPSGNGPIQYNLLAGILTIQLENIENEMNLDIEIQSSILAPLPPSPSADQTSKAVTVAISSIQADEVPMPFIFPFFKNIKENLHCRKIP